MNGYAMIIGLFIISGLAITAWGLFILAGARKTQNWPGVAGTITRSVEGAETEDLLPDIEFSYEVDGQTRRKTMEFPSGTMPTPEFNNSYLKKYPVGAQVQVFYNPEQPDEATLEPGMAGGDWMVLAAGVLTTLVGVGMWVMEALEA